MKKKIYIIGGMTCHNCENTIATSLKKIKGVTNVTASFRLKMATVTYNNNLNDKMVKKAIEEAGYEYKGTLENKKRTSFKEVFPVLLILLGLYLLIGSLIGFDFLNRLPSVDSSTPLIMLFVIGLLTSVHCIGMCGAINLAASVDIDQQTSFKRPLLYNLGRITSYTLIGGLIGLLGSVLAINGNIQGIIILVSAIMMLFMSLSMLGWLPRSLYIFIPHFTNKIKINKDQTPFVIGFLNGFMPCGPLQVMQLYALSTGSFLVGALSLFLFSLGTVPLVFSFGFLINKLHNEYNVMMQKLSSILILLLSFFMLSRAFNLMGINIVDTVTNTLFNYEENYDGYLFAEIKDGYQYVEFDLSYSEYKPIVVQKGIPVRLNIKAKDVWKYGCTNAIKIPVFKIEYTLKEGDNIIEFTPNKKGTFNYTCWMGMVTSKIKVVENIGDLNE